MQIALLFYTIGAQLALVLCIMQAIHGYHYFDFVFDAFHFNCMIDYVTKLPGCSIIFLNAFDHPILFIYILHLHLFIYIIFIVSDYY